MHLDACRLQLLCAFITARKPANLVPCSLELFHQLRPDESRCAVTNMRIDLPPTVGGVTSNGSTGIDIRVSVK